MQTNYHTHTSRCHHASGSDRDYVERAIATGFTTLGFSDHSPYLFDGDYYSTFRMRPEETEGYVASIRALTEEYKDKITLLTGYEMEYYPKTFARTVRFVADLGCDYLILGQHFVGNEESYSGQVKKYEVFDRYVHQVIEGMETGLFTYLAHPDLCQYPDDPARQEKGFVAICEAAKRLNVPLEFNMYGMQDKRHYPCDAFYKIAAQVGNVIVPGSDAHNPMRLGDPAELSEMATIAERCGITLTELSAEQVLSRRESIK